MKLLLNNLSDIDAVAQKFVDNMGNRKIFAFYGEMGAGKTTFIKALCKTLRVAETITSPTFAIINEYNKEDGDPIYHFDFYRIKISKRRMILVTRIIFTAVIFVLSSGLNLLNPCCLRVLLKYRLL